MEVKGNNMMYYRAFVNGQFINQTIKLSLLVCNRKKKYIAVQYVSQGRSI